MTRLGFDYCMKITYEMEVGQCHYTMKCIPQSTRCQRVENIKIEAVPANKWQKGKDSFGNLTAYGSVDFPHSVFLFHVTGTVETGIRKFDEYKEESIIGNYKYPHGLVVPGEGLRAYHAALKEMMPSGGTAYEKGIYFMHRLHQDFTYEKNVTYINTTAEETWAERKGVCQDYAHILIALCRLENIPARYVAGMLEGEGLSHAWVEILTPDGWCALDATNDVEVTDSHIKINVGRDAADCMINRGIIIGGGGQTQEISVSVSRL